MAKQDSLAAYNAKRDFKRTTEPAGKRASSTGGNSFVVQKHDATRLHWDFRIEVDGVLKSWAVTRGPSPDPEDKRLAVRTEDHPLAYVADHVIGAGEKLFAAMCASGQEGIISKRIDGRYVHKRSRDWLKVKCILRQEFVIVGATRSEAKGRPFSSLLLAQNEAGGLVYKGKVGTGFDGDKLDEIAARLAKLKTDAAPLDVPRAEARKVDWVKPKLVAEVAFAEFTGDGRVRHASFIGLRGDKAAKAVKPERAEAFVGSGAEKEAPVTISSRERVIFPGSGQTKGDLADYYDAVAALMLPFTARRPCCWPRASSTRSSKRGCCRSRRRSP